MAVTRTARLGRLERPALTGVLVREKLAEGMPVADAFRTYGVI